MDWKSLIDENSLAKLLPDAYSAYCRPLRDALALFLKGISPRRQEKIAIEQAAFPQTASLLDRLLLLARSSPVLHKLGQTLARDRNLSIDLRKRLQYLEYLPPSVQFEEVESVLEEQLGPLQHLGAALLQPLLAEASVAIVVPFRFSKGNLPVDGVFKVLKPGIEEHLEEELGTLDRVGSYLDQCCTGLQIPHIAYRDTFELVRDKLRYEVRLDEEQKNMALAREFHKMDSRILIPAVFPDLSTPRITAMEYVRGLKVTEFSSSFTNEKQRMAGLVIEALVARPIFSKSPKAIFHADPHAGNLFSTRDYRLAVLDWSLTGSLSDRERISIMGIITGAITFNIEKIVSELSGLATRKPPEAHLLQSVVSKWIGRGSSDCLPGFTWLKGLMDEAVLNAGLSFSSDLMLFRKALHMIDGVVADIGGTKELFDQVLLREFVLHFCAEWPWRFLQPWESRRPSTRISNADLVELSLSLLLRPIRFWLERGMVSQN